MNAVEASQPQPGVMPARLPLQIWGATDKGRSREGNEDAIFPANVGTSESPFKASPERIAEKGQLLIVADGVGGAEAGREASHWAIRVAVERFYDAPGANPGINLRQAVETANASLHQYLQSLGTRNSGTTMVAAVVHNNRLHYANVGDSRAYLFRNGELLKLTRDHSLTQLKLDQGLITAEQAENDPEGNIITRSLGARPTVDVDLFPPVELEPDDMILLCSDGLTDMISEARVAQLISGQPPRRAAQRLIDAANRAGGGDNISAVMLRAGEAPANGGAAGAALTGGSSALRKMNAGQQVILAGLALALVLVTLVGGGVVAWKLLGRGGGDPTVTATLSTAGVIAATAVPPTATEQAAEATVTATLEQTPQTTPAGMLAVTSTARPSATPTEKPEPKPLNTPRSSSTEAPAATPETPDVTVVPPTPTDTPQSPPPPPPVDTPVPAEPTPKR